MVISRTRLATTKTVFWYVLSWTACSMIAYRSLRSVGSFSWPEEFVVIASGILAGLVSASFELAAVPRLTRHYGAGAMVVLRSLGYLVSLAVFVHVFTFPLFGMVDDGDFLAFLRSERYREFVLDGRFLIGVLGLTLMSFIISFVVQVNRMLGRGTLLALLLGRYRRPVSEDRIFMFLDLRNSTSMTERLGDAGFNADRPGAHPSAPLRIGLQGCQTARQSRWGRRQHRLWPNRNRGLWQVRSRRIRAVQRRWGFGLCGWMHRLGSDALTQRVGTV